LPQNTGDEARDARIHIPSNDTHDEAPSLSSCTWLGNTSLILAMRSEAPSTIVAFGGIRKEAYSQAGTFVAAS
jgi:hypothetical protein